VKQSQLVESLRRVDPTSSAGLVRDNVDGKTAEPGNSDTLASGGRVVGVDVWMLLRGGEAHNLIEVKDCRAPDKAALYRDDAPALPDGAEERQAVPGLDNVKSDGGMRACRHGYRNGPITGIHQVTGAALGSPVESADRQIMGSGR